jgi:hypothetical protein
LNTLDFEIRERERERERERKDEAKCSWGDLKKGKKFLIS